MIRTLFCLICIVSTSLSYASFDLDVEMRAAWLVPKSHTMRNTYGKGFPEYGIELGIPLNRCFTVFSNLTYYEATGHSTFNYKSTVENWSLTFGGKYYFQPWWLCRPYFGLGAGAGYIRFSDESPYVKSQVDRIGWAFLAKIGTEICFSRYFYIDLFADYSPYYYSFKNKKGISGHKINAGGAKAGAAFCIRF